MGFIKTRTRARQNPHPWLRVRVYTGTGAGCPEKPQGGPQHSLALLDGSAGLRTPAFKTNQFKTVFGLFKTFKTGSPQLWWFLSGF
jgi:hypothetical protein